MKKIITGVSLSQKLIETATRKQAQMIVVHHGISGSQLGAPPQIKGVIRNRLKLLLENDINWQGRTGVLEAFRGIGKSSLVGLFIVWKLVNDPTLNFLIISAEDGLAKKMVKH